MAGCAGSRHAGESFLVLLTIGFTAVAVISSALYGASIGCTAAASCCSGSSQRSQSSGGKITGMRSWNSLTSALASVVNIVQVSSGLPSLSG